MTKQTAVEWLLNAIETKNGKEFSSYYTEFIEQAKEMEKEQHFNTWWHAISENEPIIFEQYYNKTYGGEK